MKLLKIINKYITDTPEKKWGDKERDIKDGRRRGLFFTETTKAPVHPVAVINDKCRQNDANTEYDTKQGDKAGEAIALKASI